MRDEWTHLSVQAAWARCERSGLLERGMKAMIIQKNFEQFCGCSHCERKTVVHASDSHVHFLIAEVVFFAVLGILRGYLKQPTGRMTQYHSGREEVAE